MVRSLEQVARTLFLKTLEHIDPGILLQKRVYLDKDHLYIDEEAIDLSTYAEVLVIGFGKASLKMSLSLEEILGDRLSRGLVATNAVQPRVRSRRIEIIEGGHPQPDTGSLLAATRAMDLLSNAHEKTLIFFLVSGGGSAMMESPLYPNWPTSAR